MGHEHHHSGKRDVCRPEKAGQPYKDAADYRSSADSHDFPLDRQEPAQGQVYIGEERDNGERAENCQRHPDVDDSKDIPSVP